MPDIRIFRNDGDEMFADDAGELDYIDPGVVLLYADTGAGIVCSYFEGRLGHPVQATVECTFDETIDLGVVRSAVEVGSESEFSVAEAPIDDLTSSRWSLDGLTVDPLTIAEPERDAIRRLVDAGSHEESGGGAGLDFTVGSTYDAARFFAFLASEFADSAATIAVSKAGRVDTVEDTDIVIHPDGDLPSDSKVKPLPVTQERTDNSDLSSGSKVKPLPEIQERTDNSDLSSGSKVKPLPETQERIDNELDQIGRERVHARLIDVVDDLDVAYRETVTDPTIDVETSKSVLRELLAERVGEFSNLTVVDSARARYRRVGIAVLATFIGLVVGVVGGVAGADSVRRTASRGRTTARDLAATDPATLGSYLVDAAGGVGNLAQGSVAALSALVLIVTVAIRHRRGDRRQCDPRPATARSDAVRVAFRLVTIGSLLALFISIVLFWTAKW